MLIVWWTGILYSALAGFGAAQPQVRRLQIGVSAAAFLFATMLLASALPVSVTDVADPQVAAAVVAPVHGPIAADRGGSLDRDLDALAASETGSPKLYFVAFAPYADQEVFRKEAIYSTRLFQSRFGAAQRSLALVNSNAELDLPAATASNLEIALKQVGQLMIPDQDILFLLLTSHGSPDGELAVRDGNRDLPGVNGPALARMLDAAGIRWRVIVVSSCYSGNFIKPLANDHTLVITAARSDRASFGCTNDADFTYFGRAYLQQGLNQSTSFSGAFGTARTLIEQWETKDQFEHSEPQIASGAAIEAKLEQWQSTLHGSPP